VLNSRLINKLLGVIYKLSPNIFSAENLHLISYFRKAAKRLKDESRATPSCGGVGYRKGRNKKASNN